MNEMTMKLATLRPEITLSIAAVVCMMLGLARSARTRNLCVWIAALGLIFAGYLAIIDNHRATDLAAFAKVAICLVGLLLLMVSAGVPDEIHASKLAEDNPRHFEPGDIMRGEYFAFFLFSLTGAMLCAGANDLIWLFLALELTSLPTYIMVATARDRAVAREAGVKYFFLGALAAAIFLYGFTLIYGATGTTVLMPALSSDAPTVASYVANLLATGQSLPPLLIAGFVLAIIGICFKIAAVPMHFYTPDVYQGANVAVTAFLAFVPKAAGFFSLIILLGTLGQPMPETLVWLLCIIAGLTMTVGNVLGLLQSNVKRVLAYSSIAHSGYMLVGLAAGMSGIGGDGALDRGVAAVLFYLVAYALATLAAFAVLGSIQRDGDEAQTYDDITGMHKRYPVLAALMLLSVLSLIGLPPMVGFIGKIYLFGTAINQSSHHPQLLWLVIVAVINSAISAVYYLRIVGACYFGTDSLQTRLTPGTPGNARRRAACFAAVLALLLGVSGNWLVTAASKASAPAPGSPTGTHQFTRLDPTAPAATPDPTDRSH